MVVVVVIISISVYEIEIEIENEIGESFIKKKKGKCKVEHDIKKMCSKLFQGK